MIGGNIMDKRGVVKVAPKVGDEKETNKGGYYWENYDKDEIDICLNCKRPECHPSECPIIEEYNRSKNIKTNHKGFLAESVLSNAQWDYLAEKYNEGYKVKTVLNFGGVTGSPLYKHCNTKLNKERKQREKELPPIETYREEFEALK